MEKLKSTLTATEKEEITVKGSHGKVLSLIPSDDLVKNRIVETLKDRLIFHDAKSVDDVLDKTKDSYEMKVWNRLNKDLWEIAYRKNNTDICLNISPSDDLSKIKVIEHERRYYGYSDIDRPVGDFDLKEMPPVKDITEKSNVHPKQRKDDVSKISFFKSESGKNAGKYILYWEDDKGKNHRVYDLLDQKERFIVSAFFKAIKEGRREEFLNDLVSKLSKAQEKEVKKDEGAYKANMIKVRSDILESDVRAAEREAVISVYTRIVDSSARRFTDEQIADIRHYRAMFTDDTPTAELFSRLFDKASLEPDVSRYPEKWSTDTMKELNDLAEGITREHGQGLKR